MAARIRFGPHAVISAVSKGTLSVIESAMDAAGILTGPVITSTQRTPLAQAKAMAYNLDKPGGVAEARRLYREPGQRVIDVWEKERKAGRSFESCVVLMAAKIMELGPALVSHHCADPDVVNVLDIDPSSIPDEATEEFLTALRSDRRVTKLLLPSDGDPAFHLEVKQPVPSRAATADPAPDPSDSTDPPFDPAGP